MPKILFVLLIFLHGLIHLMGFAKAFGYGDIAAITRPISKSSGIAWLLACILFIIAGAGAVMKKEWWPWIAFVAVILSQIIIVVNWNDARWGTLANGIILVFSLIGYANLQFEKESISATKKMLSQQFATAANIRQQDISQLPAPVQRWLTISGILDKTATQTVRLKQKGEMLLKPGGRWVPFKATQYFTVPDPGFIWTTRVLLFPMVYISGRDKLIHGKAQMEMRLLSMIRLVNEKDNSRLDSSSMIRFLAETCWFPSAALQSWMKWESIDSLSARATLQYADITVSGIFNFNEAGDLVRFAANRYRDVNATTPEQWVVEMMEHKSFDGIRVPYKCKATWKLPDGDFTWLRLELTDLAYNMATVY